MSLTTEAARAEPLGQPLPAARCLPRAVTFSSAINAWTLSRACNRLGIALRTTDLHPVLPMDPDGSPSEDTWLLFTEEASLRKALSGRLPGKFLPATFPMRLLDDKWAFAEWLKDENLEAQGLRQWSIASLTDVELPAILKPKHSWLANSKSPRGWVCRDLAEAKLRLSRLAADGLQSEDFFFQEWLGDRPMRLLSVCGFFDAAAPERNLLAITERVASYESGPSCFAAVATVSDGLGLVDIASSILARLSYRGPFELELAVTERDTKVLELNPRFWMQHGVFLAAGNGVVKRYFGLDTANDRQVAPLGKVIWIDSLWILRSLLALRVARLSGPIWGWVVMRGYRPLLFPSLPIAVLSTLKAGIRWLRRQLVHRASGARA